MLVHFNYQHPHVFCTAQNGVSFYGTAHEQDGSDNNFVEIHANKFLTKDVESQDVKCVAWHPSPDHSSIIALGQSNGKVLLRNADVTSDRVSVLAGKEFQTKNLKACCNLAWNTFSPNWLAVGLEKHGRHNCIAIWDVAAKSTYEAFQPTNDRIRVSTESITGPNPLPVAEYGSAESVDSLAWTGGKQDQLLLAGMSRKSLRLFDVRAPVSSQPTVTGHKATCGICVDPLLKHRMASYHDNVVALWDIRSFGKPVITVNAPHNIKKIEWSPTRCGFLAAQFGPSDHPTMTQTSSMLVYDMLKSISQDFGYPTIRNVPLKFPDGDWVTGFAWHPTIPSSLTVASSGQSFYMSSVTERTNVCWRGSRNVALVCGEATYTGSNVEEKIMSNLQKDDGFLDLTDLIKKRAKNVYGLSDDASANKELSLQPNNAQLLNMWNLIELTCKLHSLDSQSGTTPYINSPSSNQEMTPRGGHKQPLSRSSSRPARPQQKSIYTSGVLDLFKDDSESSGDPNTNRSEPEAVDWIGVNATKATVYRSKKRNLALALCGWCDIENATNLAVVSDRRFGRKGLGENLTRKLKLKGNTLRACAVALWHMDMMLAVEMLNTSQASAVLDDRHSLTTVAMALSGYQGNSSSSLWLETCRCLESNLKSPYLKAAFAFLLANVDEWKADEKSARYDEILDNKELLIQDRVAFASLFLPDSQLIHYLTSLCEKVVEKGKLDGLLVSGISTQAGINLLQSYVEKTLDCQTALFAAMQTKDRNLLNSVAVSHWKDSYTMLLNRWTLYNERVRFDMAWAKAVGARKPNSQILVFCNYCNKNICNASKVESERHARPRSHSTTSGLLRSPAKKGHHLQKSHSAPKKTGHHPVVVTPKRSPRVLQLLSPLQRHSQPDFSLMSAKQQNNTRQSRTPGKFIFNESTAITPRGRMGFGGNLSMQSPVTSCPSCHKPLPRCSVCSLHVGAWPLGSELDKWSSWCMKCKHGGHHGHLQEWFGKFKQCPVSDCKCNCNTTSPQHPDNG